MKNNGFIAFSATAPRPITHLVKFSHQQPQKYTDYPPNSVPTGILDNVLQTQQMSEPPSLTNGEFPLGPDTG